MRRSRLSVFLLLLGFGCMAHATDLRAGAPDPLRLVPNQADLVAEVLKPRAAVEIVLHDELFQRIQQFEAVRELYDSTNFRRFYQLVAYFEKQLGIAWPEMLDRLGGGGIALTTKFGGNPAPVLVVFQGTDDELMARFVKIGLQILEQELARQESKDRIEQEMYREIPMIRIGKDFHAAVLGSAFVYSNKDSALKKSIDLYKDGPAQSLAILPVLSEARRLLPADPVSRLWINLEPAHKTDQGKEVFALPNNQPIFTTVAGGIIDVVGRSPFVCVGSYREADGYRAAIRMPRGRAGMPKVIEAHVPPADDAGTPPLLQPKGVLYSSSFYLDPSKFLQNLEQLLNAQQRKAFDEFDKTSSTFLLGSRFSQLVSQVGAHQRVVVANQYRTGYSMQPTQPIPAFALVTEMREPEKFGKSMEAILRGAGFLTSTQFKLKLVEEKQGDYRIVGYRFPDDAKVAGDTGYARYSYSPCFAVVGRQFVACSTLELCHELVDLLHKEAQHFAPSKELQQARAKLAVTEKELTALIARLPEVKEVVERSKIIAELQVFENKRVAETRSVEQQAKAASAKAAKAAGMIPAAVRTQFYSAGGAEMLLFVQDQLLAQTILDRAMPPEAAKKQVEQIVDVVRRLGVLQFETHYGANDFQFDITLHRKK